MFDKRSLRLVAGLCVKGYKNISDGHTYLSKVMCNANPNLFEYKDVHMLLEALL